MKALLLAVLLFNAQGQETPPKQEETTTPFRSAAIGLTFSYPKEWKVTEKKTKTNAWSELEVPTKSGPARIEVFGLYFRADKEIFQISQSHAVKQTESELVRQWEEEILGAPLLLTQSKKKSETVLVGLVYSFTFNKLLFRITAPEDSFDDVLYHWRQALQSLRTFDGQILRPDDPTKLLPGETPFLGPHTVRIGGVPNTYVLDTASQPPPLVQIAAKASGKPLILAAPDGWDGKPNEIGDVVELTHPKVPGKVTVHLASTLNAESPARALFSQSLDTLNRFTVVDRRTETNPSKNKSGAMYSYIWRFGKNDKGPLVSLDAAGSVDSYYWLVAYHNETLEKEAREQLQILIDRLFLIVGS
ncbi:MAG: hypothetical protein KF784_09500 [Fimbriimonadaceae bacterium]|nr:hypothetical protein [Fimbriimonadaceae bacterium]